MSSFFRRRMPRWLTSVLACLICLTPKTSDACTTAVVSGRVTTDGRPLLWKNRDYTAIHNEVARLTTGRYAAIGVVNAGSRSSVWMGVNAAGFCIENSLSLDLKSDVKSDGPGNGGLIRRALESCATVQDFQELLQATNSPGRTTCGNFGVIDAAGGAAMFEVGRTSFVMLDANDPKTAPHGYIVRSNFSMTGQKLPINPQPQELDKISSADRYLRACSLLNSQKTTGISAEFMVRNCTRDLAGPDGIALPGSVNCATGTDGELPSRVLTANTISRATTVSAAVFHGVRPGENPALTTMFVMLGDPKMSIAVPCWVVAESVPDDLQDDRGGEIGEIALTLREWGYRSDDKSLVADYLPGIWEDLWPLEDQILKDARERKEAWSQAGFHPTELNKFSHEAAAVAMGAMQIELRQLKQFALQAKAPAPPNFSDQTSRTLAP